MTVHEYVKGGTTGVQTLMAVEGLDMSDPTVKTALYVGGAIAAGLFIFGVAKKAVKWGALGAAGYYAYTRLKG